MLSLQAERPFLTGFIGKASVVGSVPGNYDLFPARIRARNIHFRSFVGASVGATGLPEGEGSIDRQDYETGHLKYPRCAMLGFFLCIVGVAGLYFFWAKLYEDFATNMHVARDSTFLILSVCAFWGSFGLIGHAFGLL